MPGPPLRVTETPTRPIPQDNAECTFKVKKETPFSKIMNKWAETHGQDVASIRFMFDGNVSDPARPPAPLGPEPVRAPRPPDAPPPRDSPPRCPAAPQPIRPDDTPESLEMEEGDQVDAVLFQVGGAGVTRSPP